MIGRTDDRQRIGEIGDRDGDEAREARHGKRIVDRPGEAPAPRHRDMRV